ncbi:ORF210 [Saltwater crocodilepox virus]|nr:ORF210 [Saltwater crocodilepox virus]QGT48577.1 ORF210 [Saltwater crocodilepox virus]QGT48791.1 ORF210 [Saltwater crocodilepox virus]QGT49003.1 ORF210 [Saltwater crocodilepox virus]QGT49217.1 ORF210 [Saltwater crocodilepox virus]
MKWINYGCYHVSVNAGVVYRHILPRTACRLICENPTSRTRARPSRRIARPPECDFERIVLTRRGKLGRDEWPRGGSSG